MALLTYDWHPPDPTGAVNAYLSGMKIGMQQKEQADQEVRYAQKLAADGLERERLRKRFEAQQALQAQQEARLAGAEQLRQAYTRQKMQGAADLVAGQRSAADSIISQFSNPPLPSGGATAAPGVAQSLVQPDASDPLIGQPPPVPLPEPVDAAPFDDMAAADAAPISPAEMIAMGRAGKLEKPPLGPPPPDLSRGAAGGLPVASATPLPPSQLLTASDGLEPVAKPARGAAVPDVASMLRALPPKDVIAVARGAAQAQLRDALKPAATPKPDPLVHLPDGSLARVGADNNPVVIATKPPPTPPPVNPTTAANSLLTERAQYQGESSKAQLELDKLTKDKNLSALGYPWEENGQKFMRTERGTVKITPAQYDAQMDLAHQVDAYRQKITAAEAKTRELAEKISGARSGAPSSGGKQLDRDTAATLLREAGGDKEKARAMARERGYSL